jgi:hypothetical protein
MDKPLHPQGTQDVLLHASYPPTHPGRLCDWTVTSATGELPADTQAYSEWFASLPSRIETVSILNTLAFEHLMNVLVVVWALGLALRAGRFPIRRAIDDSEKTWLKTLGRLMDNVTALAGFITTASMSLKSSVALIAFWAALGGGFLDSAGMLVVFALVFHNQMVLGIGLSVAYYTWAAHLRRLPWRDTATGGRLPNYENFLANLRPVDYAARKQESVEEEQEDGDCLVCWSSDEVALELPCKRNHLICPDCLARLHESHRYQCPICRLPLYTMKNIKTMLLELIIASLGAIFALALIETALAIYKGTYLYLAIYISLAAPFQTIMWRHYRISSAASEGYLASWQTRTLAFHAFMLVAFACRLGYLLGELDQATFIDGKFVSGLAMSTALTLDRGG